MKLLSLHLVHFRNYPSLDLTFGAARNLISGSNGQGKTNLLEAIYYCSHFNSFRTRSGEDLLENGRPFFHIQAEYESIDMRHDLDIHFAEGKKIIRQDHKALPSQRRHFRNFPVFFFSHQDLDLALGPPVGRRDYFDSALALVSEPYGDTLRAYARALAQRNAELRSGSHSGIWDEALAHHGLRIIKARLSFLTAIRGHFERIYQRFFSGKGLEASIGYLHRQKSIPGMESATPADVDAYLENLLTYLSADLKTRTTHYGPHKDDFGFFFGGKSVRAQASQGQTRLFVYALKWTVWEYLSKVLGKKAVLLLDDVFADLDPERTALLFDLLRDAPQVFLASANQSILKDHTSDYDTFDVQHGSVTGLRKVF